MNKEEFLKILKEQVINSKQFTFGENHFLIIYNYLNVDYKIEWGSTHNYKYGYHIWFCCEFIKNFTICRKTQNYNTLIITEDSIKNNKKNLTKKLQTLAVRIREQVEINDFVKKIEKEFTIKVKNFISKELNFNKIKMKFFCTSEWNIYKHNSKIIRVFEYLTITVRFNHKNVHYYYSFKCYHPSKWDNDYSNNRKKITLKNKNITYQKKQITNIIRYAKLKNIFNNG